MKLRVRDAGRSRRERLGARLILWPGEILSLTPMRASVTVSCSAGRIHVTQARDPIDHVLRAGDSFRSSARGKVVVSCYMVRRESRIVPADESSARVSAGAPGSRVQPTAEMLWTERADKSL